MTWAYDWIKGLNPSTCSVVSATELKRAAFPASLAKQFGKRTSELVAAGYTAEELRKAGFTAGQLQKHFCLQVLFDAGYTAEEFEDAEVSIFDLWVSTTQSARKFVDRGYPLRQVVSLAISLYCPEDEGEGRTADFLKSEGLTDQEIREAGF